MQEVTIKISIDGNQYCATLYNFECLAIDPAGFGDTPKEAVIALFRELDDGSWL